MTEQEQTQLARETYFIEARLHWDKHHTSDGGSQSIDPNRTYIQLDGGRDTRGVMHKPLWSRIVRFAWQHDVDPVLLIKAVFASCTDHRLPLASAFVSRSALDAYKYYQGEHCLDIEFEFKNFRDSVRQKYWELEQTVSKYSSPDEIMQMVVVDPLLNCGPLFRYSLALELAQSNLALRYRHSALMEYVTSPDEFDRVLGEHLPEDFKADGRRLREKFKHG